MWLKRQRENNLSDVHNAFCLTPTEEQITLFGSTRIFTCLCKSRLILIDENCLHFHHKYPHIVQKHMHLDVFLLIQFQFSPNQHAEPKKTKQNMMNYQDERSISMYVDDERVFK